MFIRRTLLQILSSIAILAMLFSGFPLSSASAQGNDGPEHQINARIGTGFVGLGNGRVFSTSVKDESGAFQDPGLTPSPTETSLPTETVNTALTPAPTMEEGVSRLDASAGNAVPLAAATWYVATTGNDLNSCSTPGSPCLTIREALRKATAGDTIKVAVGTYTSTPAYGSEVALITKNIVLLGGWDAGFTSQTDYSIVNGQNSLRGMTINNSSAVTINRFLVRQGQAYQGGGIKIWNSAVSLDNMRIFNNTALTTSGGGGIESLDGTLTVTNGLIYGNQASSGGGISSQGNLTINNSAVFSNTAVSTYGGGSAGGISASQATISNTALYNNVAVNSGGLSVGSGTLNNVTIAKNYAGQNGGGISIGTGTLDHVTISENQAQNEGGGIYQPLYSGSAMRVYLRNSILANNMSTVADIYGFTTDNCSVRGELVSDGFSIIFPANTCNYPGGKPLDPKLGTFIPALSYYPLVVGSPAINTGNLATCTSPDQRGISRPVGAGCDLGTYEYATPGPATRLIVLDGDNQRTPPTFRFPKALKVVAVDSQGSPVPGVNVTFTAPGGGASATFTSTNSNTASVLTDAGGVATTSALIANTQTGTYTISASASAAGSLGFTLENGAWYVAPAGSDSNPCSSSSSPCATINGALNKPTFLTGDLIFVAKGTYYGSGLEVVTLNNSALLSGGWNGTFTNRDGISIIDGQDARRGLRVTTGVAAIVDHFMIAHAYTSDVSVMNGGGILNYGNLTLNFSSLHSNMAFASGGGIWNEGTLVLNNTTMNNNIASDFGGGIFNIATASMSLNNATITNNATSSYTSHAGGIYNLGAMTVKNSIIANNLDNNQHPDCYGSAAITSLGNNIIGNTSGCVITSTAGDKLNIDPKLGVFLPEQGYQPLKSDSPAINSGNSQTCHGSTDQRGVTRVGLCDMGAYEFTNPGPANSLVILEGNNQRVPPGFTFSKVLKVVALDHQGSPVPGVNVTFTAPNNGASLLFSATNTNVTSVLTDASGVASTSSFLANHQAGAYTIPASASGIGSTNFSLENGAWYVAPSGNDSNNCSLPASPCGTIGAAIGKANKEDTILVALGSYDGSNGIPIQKSLTVLGGWNNSFTTRVGQSTIQGSMSVGRYPDYYLRTNVLLEGFTITNRINSAGLTNSGTLLFQNGSIINNNSGIYNQGVITVVNSTISGNGFIGSTPSSGGGISNLNPGDARIPRALSIIINSTITNNKAYSGGGIYNDSTAAGLVILQNSLVAGNTTYAGYGSDCQGGNGSGTFTSLGYNIIGNIGTYNGAVYPCKGNWLTTDIVGNQSSPVDPGINALTNLGNNIWMHSIQLYSPAIDAVLSNNCPSADQRGMVRTHGIYCDIGAYEADDPMIGGNTGVAGVRLSYTEGFPRTVCSKSQGNYSIRVPFGWSGTITPSKIGYTFAPADRTYSNIQSDQLGQNYTAQYVGGADTTGVFRPTNGALYLKNKNETGFADIQINYGVGGDYPVVGDWDGDGDATIGIYRNSNFYLRNENTIGFADMTFPFGMPGDQPVAGDWDGDGVDTIGVYRNGTFFLRNSNDAGAVQMTFSLGVPGDVGIAGDWNGDGKDTTGVFRPSNGALYLKNTNVTGFADIQINYGLPGDRPVTGDWNDDGIDTIGVYRNGQFMLRNSNTIGFADIVFGLGVSGDMPIAGNWDGLP